MGISWPTTLRGQLRDRRVNRVVLATDGDFNVGVTNEATSCGSCRRRRRAGCSSACSASAWATSRTARSRAGRQGQRQLRLPSTRLAEAREVARRTGRGTLLTIAKDVKLQVEFNPAVVSATGSSLREPAAGQGGFQQRPGGRGRHRRRPQPSPHCMKWCRWGGACRGGGPAVDRAEIPEGRGPAFARLRHGKQGRRSATIPRCSP